MQAFINGHGDPSLANEREEKDLKVNGKEVIIERRRSLMKGRRWDKKQR